MSIKIKPIVAIALLLAAVSSVQAKQNFQKKEGSHQRPSFESIDTNTGGDIDFEEFSSLTLPHGDHQTVFSNIDTNNDGVISEDEFNNHKPPHKKNRKGNNND
jgi:Ca2+-binding EF-hand superfamily protein